MEGAEGQVPQDISIPNKGTEIYQIDGSNVHLNWYRVEPKPDPEKKEGPNPKRAAIFLGAYNYEADSPGSVEISEKIANGFGQNCLTMSTRSDRLHSDALYTESLALAEKVVLKEGISEVVIIGDSEGAIKATNLAVILEQNYPQVKIEGVILMDPMGIDRRWVLGLAAKEIMDIPIGRSEFKKAGVNPPKEYVMAFWTGIWNDLRFFGRRWPKKFKMALDAMTRTNPRLGEIKSPVLLLTGEKDYVSDYRRYFPKKELEKRAEEPRSDEDITAELYKKWDRLPVEQQQKFVSRENFIKRYFSGYRKQDEVTRMRHARDSYFREKYVPSSESSRVLIAASPGAHHAGLADIRIESVSKFATRIFQRMARK